MKFHHFEISDYAIDSILNNYIEIHFQMHIRYTTSTQDLNFGLSVVLIGLHIATVSLNFNELIITQNRRQ